MIDQKEDECYTSSTLQPLLDKAKKILFDSGSDELEFNEPKFLEEKYYPSESWFTFYIVCEL